VHSHPNGPLRFSPRDDIAEKELFRIAFDRLDSDRPHLSVIMDGSGDLVARAYGPDLKPHDADIIRTIGQRWVFKAADGHQAISPEFDRQLRVFGRQTTAALGQLRVGVVGCGGMGSAVAMLLVRIGIRRIALFDFDHVDDTNLNRLHFSTRPDANLRRLKVDVVGEGVAQIGLPISVVKLPYHVDDERARDALRACDILFGCTDDHLGRNILNRLAHFYLVPVIDLGLLIEPNDRGSYDVFDGRVTVVQPGYPCQICRGLIDPATMLTEGLRRKDPVLYEHRRRAGYIVGSPDPSPVVVTFTTEVATMAVNELFQRLNGFRGSDGAAGERVRKFDDVRDADTLPAGKSLSGCKLCDRRRYDGRGDMSPFLDTTP
jgi:molybdopterin/thiamine biosynthesis adenylyltransferase